MFNIEKLYLNRKKHKNSLYNSHFHKFIHRDIIERLQIVDKGIEEILLIVPAIKDWLEADLVSLFPRCRISIILAENIGDYIQGKYDLIIFPFGLHFIENLENFLKNIYRSLDQNGIFICNFPGGGSLHKLRLRLIELEAKYSRPHIPHISPFIQFEQMTPILQKSGFIENIIDIEKIEFEYKSALDFMKAIKNVGESNILDCGFQYSITKKMYQDLKSDQVPFTDHINLITFLSSLSKNSIKLKAI